MISPISLGAMVSVLLTAAHARALPQVPQNQSPQIQTPQVQTPQVQQLPTSTPVQPQAQPFSSFTANVFSAMRNNPSEPAGVLISLPFQTTTVTITAPASTVTISQCFAGVATPIATPVLSQPGNGLIGQPSTPLAAPPLAIPTPTSVAPGVFPPGFPTTGNLLPFLPSGTGTGFNPLASGGFISAVLPAIQSSVALEVQSLLNPALAQPSSPAQLTPPSVQNQPPLQTPGVQNQPPLQTPGLQSPGLIQSPAVQSPPSVQTPGLQSPPTVLPTPPAVQQVTTVTDRIPSPTTILNTVQVPTTVVNTVINTVQVTNTVQQVSTVTLPGTPTTVTLPATNTPVAFSSASVAPFPFPSGGVSSGFASGTGLLPTGVFPTGALPTGTALTPLGTPAVSSAFIPQGTPIPTPIVPQGTPVVSPVATPLATPPVSGVPQVGTNNQQAQPLSVLPGTVFGQAGQTGQGTIFRRHARDFVAHHMINA